MTHPHSARRRVLHIITGLEQGGTERQLTLLCNHQREASVVFSVREPGPMAGELEHTNVPIISGGARRMASVTWGPRLRQSLRQWRPDVVVGWMYHGNIAAAFTRALGFRGRLLWNVRHSVADLNDEPAATRAVIRLGARLSRIPQQIIYNSHAAAAQHEALGYAPSGTVLPNGFDLERFRPDPTRRADLRHELGLSETDWLVGVVGRAHPMKNHTGWLEALAELRCEGWPVRSLMIGAGVANEALAAEVRSRGLDEAVTLCKGTTLPESVYPALDLLALPSRWGEAFPNVVGEAMACGVPAIVTDVGDAARVVGDTGFVAAGSDAPALAEATREALLCGTEHLQHLGRLARERILSHYTVEQTLTAYEAMFFRPED